MADNASVPVANHSFTNATTNVALLYCEDPNGKVTALLHRLLFIVIGNPPDDGVTSEDEWLNITSQESIALPNEFRNPSGFNYSNALNEYSGHSTTFSRTLYEADPIAVYSTPFLSTPDSMHGLVSAIFYSPFNLSLDVTSPLAGDNFFTARYEIGSTGPGNFSLTGIHYATPSTELFREIIIILGFVPPSNKDYRSIHQSDVAAFGSYYSIWINGTQPVLIGEDDSNPSLPSSEFPFKRLASVTLTDGSATYLYHQMNGTTFAEEQWDDSLQNWVSTEYITVSDS